MRISKGCAIAVHDGAFSPVACALLHAFSSARKRSTHCSFSRRAPGSALEHALASYLAEVKDDSPFIEYWTRQRWMPIDAHADADERLAEVSPDIDIRCPSHAHVLYLAVGKMVHGPTCIWESAPSQPFGGALTTVPAVAGRVLRFNGTLQHAVPRPATLWLEDDSQLVDPIESWAQTNHPQLFERSVVLFNTWQDAPLDVAREEDEVHQDDLKPADVFCVPRPRWHTAPLAAPPAGQPTAFLKLQLLGDAARRGQLEPSLTLPIDEDLVRSALAADYTVTRLEPVTLTRVQAHGI